jgi:hypothetical protein
MTQWPSMQENIFHAKQIIKNMNYIYPFKFGVLFRRFIPNYMWVPPATGKTVDTYYLRRVVATVRDI